jgi:hypothetical protein
VGQITFKSNSTTGTASVITTKAYDKLNRLTSIVSAASGGASQWPISYAYQYNAASQRTRCTLYDNSYWLYGYDYLLRTFLSSYFRPNWRRKDFGRLTALASYLVSK